MKLILYTEKLMVTTYSEETGRPLKARRMISICPLEIKKKKKKNPPKINPVVSSEVKSPLLARQSSSPSMRVSQPPSSTSIPLPTRFSSPPIALQTSCFGAGLGSRSGSASTSVSLPLPLLCLLAREADPRRQPRFSASTSQSSPDMTAIDLLLFSLSTKSSCISATSFLLPGRIAAAATKMDTATMMVQAIMPSWNALV